MRVNFLRVVGLGAVVCGLVPACSDPSGEIGLSSAALDSQEYPSTVVSLTFDDGVADQWAAVAPLRDHGMQATFYVNSGRLDRRGYLSMSQVVELSQAGHEIGGHSLTHEWLSADDEAQQWHEICADRAALLAAGFSVRSFAYPFGAAAATARLVAACGYSSARDIGGLVYPESCPRCAFAETVPPRDWYALRTAKRVSTVTTLETLQTYVTGAEAHGGGWLLFVFHHVCDGCNPNAITPELLAEFLTWLGERSARNTHVVTVGDYVGGDLRPLGVAPVVQVE